MPFWAPKWLPASAAPLDPSGLGGCQDGLEIVSVRSFFCLAVWDGSFGPLRLLLGSFWGALEVVLQPLGSFCDLLGLVFESPRSF